MTGLIPKQFIVDLVERADVAEIVGRRVQLKKAGKEFKACCPFHDEKTPSFTVSPTKGFYHCFGCGVHGTALDFLMEYDHMDFVDAVESLAAIMGLEVPRSESNNQSRSYDSLFELLDRVSVYYEKNLKSHETAIDYLKTRGINGATAKRFSLGYAPSGWNNLLNKFGSSKESIDRLLATGLIIRKDSGKYYDRFRDRIMFPIRDARGRTIGFGGRIIGDEKPKYLNSPETVLFHKGRELYGLYESRQALRNIEKLVVVEGYMDVVGLAQHGIDFSAATLGTATTDEHLNRLFRICEEIVFSFDGDRAGRAAAWKALQNTLPHIREGRQIRFIFLPEGQDPDSFIQENGPDAFTTALNNALPLSDFLIDELTSKLNVDTVDGRARLAELARPLLSKIPAGVYKDLLTEQLAVTIGLPPHRLEPLFQNNSAEHGKRSHGNRTKIGSSEKNPSTGKPSIVRKAITLIIHHPASALQIDIERLSGNTRPGIELLNSLIKAVNSEPKITTAGLLERFRNDAEGRHLGKLAATELPGDDNFDSVAELRHCLTQLELSARRTRIETLIDKQRTHKLTSVEKTELRELTKGP